MRYATLKTMVLAAVLSGAGPASSEERLTRVQVEGFSELRSQIQQLEAKLTLLLGSSWEYRFIQRNRFDSSMQSEVAALGREGWELVNVTIEEGYIFKRRVLR